MSTHIETITKSKSTNWDTISISDLPLPSPVLSLEHICKCCKGEKTKYEKSISFCVETMLQIGVFLCVTIIEIVFLTIILLDVKTPFSKNTILHNLHTLIREKHIFQLINGTEIYINKFNTTYTIQEIQKLCFKCRNFRF